MTIKYSDSGFLDGADETKKLSFDVSGVTTGTTRTITMPDGDTKLYTGDGTSGQVLTSGGAGVAPTFQTTAAGISQIHQWRFHTSFSSGGGGTITSNWEQVDTDDPSNLGTAMSVNGSGEWTFPSTGHWLITAQVLSGGSGDINYVGVQILTKTIGAGWSNASEGYNSTSTTATANISAETSFIFDVTNTSTSLAKFTFNCIPSWITLAGSTNRNYNLFTFTKLADT